MPSKNTPNQIISGLGWAINFLRLLLDKLFERGVSKEEIHRLGTKEGANDLERAIDAFVEALADKVFDPNDYFVTRSGLYVWNEFTERILAVTKPARASGKKPKPFNLPKPMNNAEIRAELGEGHIFEDAGVFCATLARMIDAQASGQEGELLNNGRANIFYVRGIGGEVFTVRASWRSGRRRWNVGANRLDGHRWYAGYRAFSATAVA